MAKVKIKFTIAHLERIKSGKAIEVRLPPNATELRIEPPDTGFREFLNQLEELFKR